MTSPFLRRSVGAMAVGVLALTALAACKSDSGSGSGTAGGTGAAPAGTSAPAAGAAQQAGSSSSCTSAVNAAVAALVTVSVSPPSSPGGAAQGAYDCEYGIGANKDLSGAALETATGDTILVTVIGVDAQDQYSQAVGYGAPIPVPNVGDKAEYFFFPEEGAAPNFYAIKGTTYCAVQVDASNQPTELGVAGTEGGGVTAAGAATIAQKEGAICNAVF